jgi:hypothetical protein
MTANQLRRAAILAALITIVAPARAADRFLDSDEYKEGNYKTACVITDYADMVEGDGVNWVWMDPASKLGGPGTIEIVAVKNVSDVTDVELAGKVQQTFQQAFQRVGKASGPGGLVLTSCIFWVERADTGRAFIPFAGAHLMQAGIGIELTITDPSGKVVAKIRHDGRNGTSPTEAAGEVVDDVANYVAKH